MFPPQSRTEDGFELTFGTNHLGPFLLTELLLDLLKASAPSRIINLSSRAHERGHIDLEDLNFEKRGYGAGLPVYSQSKLANLLHAKELARRLEGTGVTAVSLHPGVVTTGTPEVRAAVKTSCYNMPLAELQRHIPYLNAIGDTVLYPIVRTFFKNPWQGTQTTLYTILDPKVPSLAGEYFADCAMLESPNAQAYDADLARAFWSKSEEMVAGKGL
jgi:retinol dehydrogenase-12